MYDHDKYAQSRLAQENLVSGLNAPGAYPADVAGPRLSHTAEPVQPLFAQVAERLQRLQIVQEQTEKTLGHFNEQMFGAEPNASGTGGVRPSAGLNGVAGGLLNMLDAAIDRACSIQGHAINLTSRSL